MLPYSGTYAQLGTAITNGFKLAVNKRGGRLDGRELEYFTVDDEAEPSKAPENTNRLVQRDKVRVSILQVLRESRHRILNRPAMLG